jgi:hypothetical protein
VLSLRNRAVRVASSLFATNADLPSTTPAMNQSAEDLAGPVREPTQNEWENRFSAMEKMLQDLTLQIATNNAKAEEPGAPADPVYQVQDDPDEGSTLIRNRRYKTVLSVSSYRLRDQTTNLRPDQMTHLSSTAALIRPLLEGSFLLALRPYAFFPFWPISCASKIKHKYLKQLYCGFLRTSSDLLLRNPIVYKLTVRVQVLFNGFFLHMHQNPL